MNKIDKLIIAVCAVFMVAGSGQAAASCSQADAAGTWRINGVVWDQEGVDETESIKCKIKVTSAGNISGSKSICTVFGAGTVDVSGGNVALAKNCSISGKLKTNGGTVKFRSGQMDRSKDSFAILGVDTVLSYFEFYLDGIRQ